MITSSIKTSKCAFEPNKITKTLAKIGGFIPKPVSDFCDLTTKASMKRTTQFAILAACVLFARYIQARNKDEKREILTRDTGMLFTAVYAVPLFKKVASLFINKKTGINFGKRPEDIFYYCTNGAGLIIRRSFLAKTDIFPLNIASDIVFMFQSIKNGASVKFCRLKLYKMIIDKHNISVRTEVPYELYKIVKKYAPRKYYFLYAFLLTF